MITVDEAYYNSMKNQALNSIGRRNLAEADLFDKRRRLEQLNKELGEMSAEDLIAFQKNLDASKENLQDELDSLKEELGIQLGKQALENKELIESISKLAQGNKEDLDDVSEQISKIEKSFSNTIAKKVRKIESDKTQAMFYYSQLSELIEHISKLYPEKYEALFPEQLNPQFYVLKTTIGYVADNIENEYYEVAIGIAQLGMREAVNSLALLECFHAEFLNIKKIAETKLKKLIFKISELEKPKITKLTIEDSEYADKYGIAYWTRELYGEILDRVEEIQNKYKEFNYTHDAKKMSELSKDVDVIEEQINYCQELEENERKLHYECCEKAAQILDALNENDRGKWHFQDIHIDEEDLRKPVYINLTNSEGYMLSIACIPERDIDVFVHGTVRCEFDIFNLEGKKKDDTHCNIIYENIALLLADRGLPILDRQEYLGNVSNSNSFRDIGVCQAEEKRARWVMEAKKKIGLFEEV